MKKIAVFTGTRAEYGLLYFLLKELQQADALQQAQLQLWVGGTHLSKKYGYTLEHILADGFTVTEQLDFLQTTESPLATAKSLSLATKLAAQAFEKHQPDILVVLGDRYEALAIVQTAMLFNVPIAHIHGGEITQGAIDDVIRHAISKMSHLHFTAAETYRQRLIQMGEQPDTVFNVGAPGLDYLNQVNFLTLEQLSEVFKFNFTEKYFLITFHPETLGEQEPLQQLTHLFDALSFFSAYQFIITYPNADANGDQIITALQQFEQQNKQVLLLSSMGQLRYLSAMKYATAVIGNSSSGIIEAPSFFVPTVNIGDRQKGRLASDSVLNCLPESKDIIDTINKAIELKASNDRIIYQNPYGQGQASKAIASHLLAYQKPSPLQKEFYDLDNQA
ncbi:MAG: UDP-N-acetylglucosamine 2-epimerase [Thalassotalea sp.]